MDLVSYDLTISTPHIATYITFTTVVRQLEPNGDPICVVDFWGKFRVSCLLTCFCNTHSFVIVQFIG